MTDHQPQGWDDVHALVGAYAVDALDDIERARFEAHLRGCPDCRLEVESLQEAAAALAIDPVEPPAGLRAAVLADIESIRPLPPLVEHDREAVPDRVRRRPWLSTTGPLLVAAALVVVALLTTVWLKPWAADDGKEDPVANPTEQVLAADDRETVVRRFSDGSSAKVVVSRSERRAVIITEDMAPAPAGKVYELWFQTPQGDMIPAGLMPDDDDATVLLDGDARDATAVGITVEPDGGSPKPTTPPIALFELTST